MTVRSLITVAGSVAGAIAFSNPFTVAAVAVGSAVLGGIIDPVETKTGSPLKENLNNSTAVGRVLPIVYGTYPFDQPFFIYAFPFEVVKKKKRTGLFSKVTETKNRGTWRRGICEGPGTLLKMWWGGELAYDQTRAGPIRNDLIAGDLWDFTTGDPFKPPYGHEIALFGTEDLPAYHGIVTEVVHKIFIDRFGGYPQAKYLVAQSTSDAFPRVDYDETNLVGPSTPTGSQWHFNDGRHWFSTVGGELRVFDNATFGREHEHNIGFTLRIPAVSQYDNNIYGDRDIFLTSETYRIDPETLTAISRTDDAGTDSFVGGFIRVGGSLALQVLFLSKTSTLRIYLPDHSLGDPVIDPFDPTGALPVMNRAQTINYSDFISGTAFPTPSFNGRSRAAIDGSGDLWTILESSSETNSWLMQVSALTLEVVFTRELTEVNDGSINGVGYDPGSDGIYFAGTRKSDSTAGLFKYTIASGALDFWSYPPDPTLEHTASQYLNQPTNSRLWFKAGTVTMVEMDLATMTTVRTLSISNWDPPGNDGDYDNLSYDAFNHAIISHRDDRVWMMLDRLAAGNTSVKLITENLSERLGLSITDDVDATAGVSQIFQGYPVDSQQPAANDLAEINTLFFNTIRPHDGKTQLVTRGGGVDKVLDNDLLGAVPADSAVGPPFTESEGQEREILPAQYILNYKDPAKDYEARNQTKRRDDVTIATEHAETLTTKAAITAQQAADWVVRMEGLARAGRKEFELSTVLANLLLEPGDVFQISDDTSVLRLFAEETELTQEGVYKLKARTEEAPIFNLTGDANTFTESEDTITIYAASFFNVLDVPHVQQGLQSLALQVVAGPSSDLSWKGLDIFEAPDALDFMAFVDVDFTEAVQGGFLTTALPAGKMHGWDRANSFTINLQSGVLAALTEQQVLTLNTDGTPANGLWIEADDGTWEVVLFSGVTDNGDGTWVVGGSGADRGLLRGMFNTEEAMNAGHSIGRRVYVIPDADNIISQEIPSSWLMADRTFIGEDPETEVQAGTRTLSPVLGNSLKPYPVVQIEGAISTFDWMVTFRRQGRNMGPSNSFSGVPQGVTTLDFVARVYDGATLKRTITTTASAGGSVITVSTSDPGGEQSLTYTSADQITDFGASPISTLEIEIAQIEENGIEGPARKVSFIGPSTPQPETFSNVKLLVHFDGTNGQTTYTDDSDSAHALTNSGSCALTTTNPRHGTASLGCPGGSSDRVTVAASIDFTFGLGDYTLECWVILNSASTTGFLTRGTTGSAASRWLLWANNTVRFSQAATHHLVGTTDIANDGLWHHIAVARVNGVTRLFVDGAKEDETNNVYDITDVAHVLNIGDEPASGGAELAGQMDDLRIIKGEAIYVTDFIPPTSPHPNS